MRYARGVLLVVLTAGPVLAGASASAGPSDPPVDAEAAQVEPSRSAPPSASPSPAASGIEDAAVAPARPGWIRRIDRLTSGRPVSVCVGSAGTYLYRRKAGVRRIPASNEKLLLSMAILDRLGPDFRVATQAASGRLPGRSISGRLWILGAGDPETDRSAMRDLARRVRAAGVRRIRGRVFGSTGYFARDWWARGWKPSFPSDEVALPTALTFEHNEARGRHIRDPERRAAASLTKQLRALGVRVGGKPGAGKAPRGLARFAEVRSRPLEGLLRRANVKSKNFAAEVLGKRLGLERSGPRGTIRKGAAAIEAWARSHGVRVEAHDSSGLSYANRVTASGIVRLLWAADGALWTDELRRALPRGGQGTLAHRLRTVDVRAKTGTLDRISALSGWVKLERTGTWAEFSILSRGMSKDASVRIEDRIVRAVAANAS
jgi:D-alanyl-D-alanine carboxypeptidase/D-alanyl-D-alanine-endopeptidase (penicillin-binding protein 4)